MKGFRGGSYGQFRPAQISADVLSVNEGAPEITVRFENKPDWVQAEQSKAVFVRSGRPGSVWTAALLTAVDTDGTDDTLGAVKVLDIDIQQKFGNLIRLLKPGDTVGLWLLTEKKKATPAALRLTVVPVVPADPIFDGDDGDIAVAGLGRENKKKLKKEWDLNGGKEDWTAQFADVAVADSLGEEKGRELAALLQGQINSEEGLGVDDLPRYLENFEVIAAKYKEAVNGNSTRTMAFGLTEAALAQRRVAGVDRDTKDRLIYIDIDRQAIDVVTGLYNDNSINIETEASDVSGRFGTLDDVEDLFLEIRKELKELTEQKSEQVRRKQLAAGDDVLFEKPAIDYAISVMDNEGIVVLEGCKVYKVLTTSTTTSKGYVKGFRIVAGGSGTSYPMGTLLIAADKPLLLKDVHVVIERIVPAPISWARGKRGQHVPLKDV